MSTAKNIVAFGLVLLFTFATQHTFAQSGQQGNVVEKLKNHIELTTEQEIEINAIATKYQARIQALRSNETVDRNQIKQLRQAQRAEVNKVLTTEQQQILQDHKVARRTERKAQSQVDKRAVRTELKTYRDENIKPVLLMQRSHLENKISAADRTTLAELRSIFAAEKLQHKAKREKGERPTKEARTAQRAAFKQQYADEIATLRALTQKYATELAEIRTALAPQIEKWRADQQAIAKKYRTETGEDGSHINKKKRHKMDGALEGKRAQGRFLLMDPTE